MYIQSAMFTYVRMYVQYVARLTESLLEANTVVIKRRESSEVDLTREYVYSLGSTVHAYVRTYVCTYLRLYL